MCDSWPTVCMWHVLRFRPDCFTLQFRPSTRRLEDRRLQPMWSTWVARPPPHLHLAHVGSDTVCALLLVTAHHQLGRPSMSVQRHRHLVAGTWRSNFCLESWAQERGKPQWGGEAMHAGRQSSAVAACPRQRFERSKGVTFPHHKRPGGLLWPLSAPVLQQGEVLKLLQRKQQSIVNGQC